MMYFWPKRNMRTTGRAESRAPAEKAPQLSLRKRLIIVNRPTVAVCMFGSERMVDAITKSEATAM